MSDFLIPRTPEVAGFPVKLSVRQALGALVDGVPGQGQRLFEFVAEMDLEGRR